MWDINYEFHDIKKKKKKYDLRRKLQDVKKKKKKVRIARYKLWHFSCYYNFFFSELNLYIAFFSQNL